MSDWLDSSNNANCFKQTYVQGFVDVSGGSIITRGTGGGLVIGGDSSLNGTVYLGNSIFVRSDGLVAPGTAYNGATSYDVSGNADNGATSYDLSGTAQNNARSYDICGNATNGASVLSISFPSDASWSRIGPDIYGESNDDRTHDCAANSDCTIIAATSFFNDGTSTNSLSNYGNTRVFQYRTIATQAEWDDISNNVGINYSGVVKSSPTETWANSTTKYWVQMGADIDGEYENYNLVDYTKPAVALSSDGLIIAIGGHLNNATGVKMGHARVYQYKTINESDWTNYNTTDRIYTGTAPFNKPVLISGGDTSWISGKKYWVQMGADIDGLANNDYTGYSVALSANGHTLAVGGYFAGTNTKGYVRIYNFTNNNWVPKGQTINGERDTDKLGRFVSLSSDGNIILANGEYASALYEYVDSSWNQLGGTYASKFEDDRFYISGTSVSYSNHTNALVKTPSGKIRFAIGMSGFSSGKQYSFLVVFDYDSTKTVKSLTRNDVNFGPVGWRKIGYSEDKTTSNGGLGRGEYKMSFNSDGTILACPLFWGNRTVVFKYDANKLTTSNIYTDANFGPVSWRLFGDHIAIEAPPAAQISSDGTRVAVCSSTSNNSRGLANVYEITNTKTYYDVFGGYYDVSGGYYDVSGGYLNDGLTSAALYVNGDTDLSGGLTVSGDVSFNTGNLFVAGDLSLNGNLYINSYAANSINADAIDSTVDIEFANKLSVATADLSLNGPTLQVAINFNTDNAPTDLATNLTVPANIAIVDGSNGTVYGSYLTLTNKDATAYYNVGKSVSGIFNIVNQANAGVYLASGGTSFTGTSDARLKTNVAPLESATDKIMALNPCTYQWKSDVESTDHDNTKTTKTHIGFIAQEVEQVMPELVHNIDHPAGPDYKGVNTTDLIPYLVRTIQEQNAELDELTERLEKLSA